MSEYKLNPPRQAAAVVGACKKIEETVVGTYKKVEDTVTGGYKKVEDTAVGGYKAVERRFVDTFLEKVDDDDRDGEAPSAAEE